jgi:hypothetical protein
MGSTLSPRGEGTRDGQSTPAASKRTRPRRSPTSSQIGSTLFSEGMARHGFHPFSEGRRHTGWPKHTSRFQAYEAQTIADEFQNWNRLGTSWFQKWNPRPGSIGKRPFIFKHLRFFSGQARALYSGMGESPAEHTLGPAPKRSLYEAGIRGPSRSYSDLIRLRGGILSAPAARSSPPYRLHRGADLSQRLPDQLYRNEHLQCIWL